MSQDLNLFCRMNDIANNNEAIGSYIRFPLECFLLIFIIYRLTLLVKYRIANNIIKIHFWMLLWGLAYCGADSIKLLQYQILKNITSYYDYSELMLSTLPRIFTFFDACLGIIITTLLFLCPYYWIQNILYFLQGISTSSRQTYKYTRKYNKAVFLYLLITRTLFLLCLFGLLFVPLNILDYILHTMIYFLGSESIFVIGCVVYGQKFLLKHFEQITITDDTKNVQMKIQSSLLIVVCVCRMLHNVIITTLSSIYDSFRSFIPTLCIEQQNAIYYAIKFNLITLFTQFLPIIIILMLYKPEANEEYWQKKQSTQYTDIKIDSTILI